jgi:hypothetical protein
MSTYVELDGGRSRAMSTSTTHLQGREQREVGAEKLVEVLLPVTARDFV